MIRLKLIAATEVIRKKKVTTIKKQLIYRE